MKVSRNQEQSWKDKMFKELAPEFVDILKAKSLHGDVTSFVKKFRSGSVNRFAILDLGCGVGRLFPHLSEAGTLVVGLDYSDRFVSAATKVARTLPNTTVILHDMRNLNSILPTNSFDMVIRAYTSLGYFSAEVETKILTQCSQLVVPGGRLIVDTFNAEWFRAKGTLKRSSSIGCFELEEEYVWDASNNAIACVWRYKYSGGRIDEIPFILDGYDIHRIDDILSKSGWSREALFRDLSPLDEIAEGAESERLVVVAQRMK